MPSPPPQSRCRAPRKRRPASRPTSCPTALLVRSAAGARAAPSRTRSRAITARPARSARAPGRRAAATVDPDAPTALVGLRYLGAVCKETLRIHPVIPLVAREVQRSLQIEGYVIPASATVAPCIYLTHHRDDLYPQPDEFWPERFLAREYSPYEFLPFGGGVRRCIGMPLALHEMKVVLGTILQRCQLELTPPEPVRPVRRAITIAPSGGTRMTVARILRST